MRRGLVDGERGTHCHAFAAAVLPVYSIYLSN